MTPRRAEFTDRFRRDFKTWWRKDKPRAYRVIELVAVSLCYPEHGDGNPHPLKHTFSGCIGRTIHKEHRLVYEPSESTVVFLRARGHYDD